jgi:ethanolamine permease
MAWGDLADIRYRTVSDDFFAQRQLTRYAGTWSVLAFGVGAVIAGEYTGWNPGLIDGGFGGLLVATLLVTLMYVALCLSLAELAAAMPFAGAAYAYSRAALGSWGGFLGGLTQAVAALLGSAVFVVQIGDTIAPALERVIGLRLPEPVWWAVLYGIFAAINIFSVALFFRVAVVLCAAALGVLALFWYEATSFFEMHLALNTPAGLGGTPWLPNGLAGVAWALPFAIWFFINIEQAPMAAEETKRPERAMPRALLWGMVILIVAALLTLFLNSGVSPGAAQVGSAKEALLVAFENVLVFSVPYGLLPFLYLVGLIASFHTSIYAYSRSLYVLSRAGYITSTLSVTHPARRTPHYSIIAGTLFAYAVALVIYLLPRDSNVSVLLINMSVFSALISYLLVMAAYVILARDYPEMLRPYRSPLGVTGAITAFLLAAAAVLLLFHNPAYRPGLYGAAAILAGGIVYFAAFRRHRLIASPEEVFALNLPRQRQEWARRANDAPASGAA